MSRNIIVKAIVRPGISPPGIMVACHKSESTQKVINIHSYSSVQRSQLPGVASNGTYCESNLGNKFGTQSDVLFWVVESTGTQANGSGALTELICLGLLRVSGPDPRIICGQP